MRRIVIIGVLVLAVGAGCTIPVTPTLLPTPTPDPATGPTPTTPPIVTPLPTVEADTPPTTPPTEAITQAAVTAAATTLNIPEAEFVVINAPLFVEWADTSLGCPQPGATYEDEPIPGYLVTLAARGQTYNVHTDQSGDAVLCLAEGQTTGQGGLRDPIVAEFIMEARAEIAAETGLPLDEVVLVRSEAVQWSTSALGCTPPEGADVMDVTTPGYRIELVAEETRYFFHTSQQRMIRCADPTE